MFDLHTHSLLSDGALVIAELVRRAEVAGYRGMVISDHVDGALVDFVVPRVAASAADLTRLTEVLVVAGAEITHCPPGQIAELVARARKLGAALVTVHGETIAEPVKPGTNRAAIEAGADLLAHPGLISEEDVKAAASRGVRLEISGRKGHSLTNGHVAALARKHGAQLYFGSDAHEPGDLVRREQAQRILLGAGLSPQEAAGVLAEAEKLVRKMVSS